MNWQSCHHLCFWNQTLPIVLICTAIKKHDSTRFQFDHQAWHGPCSTHRQRDLGDSSRRCHPRRAGNSVATGFRRQSLPRESRRGQHSPRYVSRAYDVVEVLWPHPAPHPMHCPGMSHAPGSAAWIISIAPGYTVQRSDTRSPRDGGACGAQDETPLAEMLQQAIRHYSRNIRVFNTIHP